MPMFLSHKGAIEFCRPAWVKRWPFPSDHTGLASTNTGERAERWQSVPWSGSSSLWLEAQQRKTPCETFSLLLPFLLLRSGTQRHLWKCERCAALLKQARAHARAKKARCLLELASVPAATLPARRRRKPAQDARAFLPNNRKALCFGSQLPFPLFV